MTSEGAMADYDQVIWMDSQNHDLPVLTGDYSTSRLVITTGQSKTLMLCNGNWNPMASLGILQPGLVVLWEAGSIRGAIMTFNVVLEQYQTFCRVVIASQAKTQS